MITDPNIELANQENNQMGVAPIVAAGIAAIPSVLGMFKKKRRPAPPPPPPKPNYMPLYIGGGIGLAALVLVMAMKK